MDPPHDWRTGTGGAMVSVGTHSLSVSVSGIPQAPTDPLVVCLPGAGDSAVSYRPLERLVSPFARVLLYERSGIGRSEDRPGKTHHVAVEDAEELHRLLVAMSIPGPLLLVAHSYGAIIAREYCHLYPADVAGMVLADAATEKQHLYFSVPDANINAVLGNLKFAQVTGLRDESMLTREEWRERAAAVAQGALTSVFQRETSGFIEGCEMLAEKKQYENQALENKPLSVIICNGARDYRRVYDAGIAVGNGTEEQRNAFRQLLGRWEADSTALQMEQLQLSSNNRLVRVPDCGHNVHMTRPDVVCEEVKWVRDQIIRSAQAAIKL